MATRLTSALIAQYQRQAVKTGKGAMYTDANGRSERGGGALVLRTSPRGAPRWYFRYVNAKGQRVSEPLGVYAADALLGVTLKDARTKAAKLSLELRTGEPSGLLPQVDQPRVRARRKEMSLEELMGVYQAELERQGKAGSARDVESLIRIHLTEGFPRLATKAAARVTPDEISDLISSIIAKEHKRTAGKVRSFLHAAYAAALTVGTYPSVARAYKESGVVFNPVASVRLPGAGIRNRTRRFQQDQLGDFLRLLSDRQGMAADALRLVLWLGGQRLRMLLRAKVDDLRLTDTEGVLTLSDPKGHRREPRPHLLPLFGPPLEILRRLQSRSRALSTPLLFTTNGSAPLSPETVTELFRTIARQVEVLSDDPSDVPLQLRDLRRTAETELGALQVAPRKRAFMQSHDLGGVQLQHYDFHDVKLEVREALTVWHDCLARFEREARERAALAPNVVPIAPARRAKNASRKAAGEAAKKEGLLTLAALARFLHIGKPSLKAMLTRGELPPGIAVGDTVRWNQADVLAWLQARSDTLTVVRAVA